MKELKALEILIKNKKLQSSVEPNYLKQAIKELEELNNMSCDGCIHNTFENEQCIFCSRRCVDFYETKGE